MHVNEPAGKQVVVKFLTEGSLTADREQENQEGSPQKPVRRNGRPDHLSVHTVEIWRKLGQGPVGQRVALSEAIA